MTTGRQVGGGQSSIQATGARVEGGSAFQSLTLSNSTVTENVSTGTLVGNLQNRNVSAALSMVNNAGGRLTLSGDSVVTASAIDYEAGATLYAIVRETIGATSQDSLLIISVTNVQEVLNSPAMTSANSPLPYAVISDPPAGSGWQANGQPWKAFNGAIGTETDGYPAYYSSPPSGIWLGLVFPVAVKLHSYTLTATDYSGSWPGLGHPRAWTIQGSNDGATWSDIETRTDTVPSAGATRTYTLASLSAPYLAFRIVITATGSNASSMSSYLLLGDMQWRYVA